MIDQGVAYSFGRNDKGQLGNGSNTEISDPYKINIPNEKIIGGSTGRGHTLLLTGKNFLNY
jgi:alpha-tubulin suppressor-like RCC1 family protein